MYRIIVATNAADLAGKVILAMELGWVPQGGIARTTTNNTVDSSSNSGALWKFTPSRCEYMQAMIKLPTKKESAAPTITGK